MNEDKSLKLFKRINLIFWGIWLLIPCYIAASTFFWDQTVIFSGLGEGCTDAANRILSEKGKIAALLFFTFDTLLYLILFALMHVMVNDCAKGSVFIGKSVSIMGYIAMLIIIWPLLHVATFNLTKYFLFSIGDLPEFKPEYTVDVMMIGAGFFFLMLRFVLLHALKLHEDSKLTI
jgi:hypothetical protein